MGLLNTSDLISHPPAAPSVPVLLEGDSMVGQVALDEVLVVVDVDVADDALVHLVCLGVHVRLKMGTVSNYKKNKSY